ncbi:Uncharacterized protein TCM_012937 [Theobroma cacao]|uniref:Uncharacterized protein n=1 Tax=Theobroma cacao TaxID=3641 RepID=A0A061FX24_THECC|nr:Uncharacterized protein TCM_012937 [Theobroma cacao]
MEFLCFMNEAAYNQLIENWDAVHWCQALFSDFSKYDVIDNNMFETFNGVIIEARCKSIISMLEDIELYVIRRLVQNKEYGMKWKTEHDLRILTKLEKKNKGLARKWEMDWNGDHLYEILVEVQASMPSVLSIMKERTLQNIWQTLLKRVNTSRLMNSLSILSKGQYSGLSGMWRLFYLRMSRDQLNSLRNREEENQLKAQRRKECRGSKDNEIHCFHQEGHNSAPKEAANVAPSEAVGAAPSEATEAAGAVPSEPAASVPSVVGSITSNAVKRKKVTTIKRTQFATTTMEGFNSQYVAALRLKLKHSNPKGKGTIAYRHQTQSASILTTPSR